MGQPNYVQSSFRYRDDDGTEAGATWTYDENVDGDVDVDTIFRMRIAIDNTGNKDGPLTARLMYSYQGGAYTPVTETSSVIKSDTSTQVFADEDPTTDQLAVPAGTFLAGKCDDADGTGGVAGEITITQAYNTEYEFTLSIVSGDVNDNDTIALQIYMEGTPPEALNTYTKVPTISVNKEVVAPTVDSWFRNLSRPVDIKGISQVGGSNQPLLTPDISWNRQLSIPIFISREALRGIDYKHTIDPGIFAGVSGGASLISIPATWRPSYKQGFARSVGEAAYPGLWKGLKGLWSPQLGPVGTKFLDLTGNGRDIVFGELLDGTDVRIAGDRYALYTADDVASTVDHVDFQIGTGSFSVAGWVRPAFVDSSSSILKTSQFGGTNGWFLGQTAYQSGRLIFEIWDNITNYKVQTVSGDPIVGHWYHLVGVIDRPAGFLRLYVDGVLFDSVDISAASASDIGNDTVPIMGYSSDADVSEAAIWDRVITLNEIDLLYRDQYALTRPLQYISISQGVEEAAPGVDELLTWDYKHRFLPKPEEPVAVPYY